eukprot:TRINITY_DN33133_c0_g1_i5.p1 TRINITY_DN33133_c0_g1~~TRINITY_DN33133_c0_g1_i5.p1  ORF type:complete len:109 (+),score=1.72 TRINITY_DN33133_c0_g1_i5:172-498(+)
MYSCSLSAIAENLTCIFLAEKGSGTDCLFTKSKAAKKKGKLVRNRKKSTTKTPRYMICKIFNAIINNFRWLIKSFGLSRKYFTKRLVHLSSKQLKQNTAKLIPRNFSG